ncbi:MAG: MFS transporter [Rhodobacteraceae bacterium]|nr:MFS transporter [Paracoccaceae bacterium]
MFQVLNSSWALFAGMFLLMVGNGLQGTLLGIRGGIEGFSTFQMSVVMSAYFAGFMIGSRVTPEMIRRVGHVRVFAALGSFISAALILYPAITDPWAWSILRVIIGFSFCGVYITAESWLNNAATNETRGKALSLYMMVQMGGIVSAQALLNLGDPSGFILFIITSVLVSISFAPILLSVNPTPAFETTKRMSLRDIFNTSPLGCIGMFLVGGVFSSMFGMSSVYGSIAGLTVAQISIFVSSFYVGGLLLQFPIGWASDRMDRRHLIFGVAAAGGVASLGGLLFSSGFAPLVAIGFLIGGLSNPLYALLLAYTNDFLDVDDMAAASGGLLFINGMGAIFGPLALGPIMETVGPEGYFLFIAILMLGMAAYAAYRMTQRPAPSYEDNSSYVPVYPSATPVVMEAAQEVVIEAAEEATLEAEATS